MTTLTDLMRLARRAAEAELCLVAWQVQAVPTISLARPHRDDWRVDAAITNLERFYAVASPTAILQLARAIERSRTE